MHLGAEPIAEGRSGKIHGQSILNHIKLINNYFFNNYKQLRIIR